MLPKRIVVIAGYAPSLVNFRGPLLRSLREKGHQVIALAPEDSLDVKNTLGDWGVHYKSISLDRTGMNPKRDAKDLVSLISLLKELKPDIVLAYTIKPVTYGLLAARCAGVRNRYALITGLGYSFQGKSLKRRALTQITSKLYKSSLKGANAVIFQNPDDRNLFVDNGLISKEQVVVVNGSGVDLAYYKPVDLPEEPIFLLIARLLKEKGIFEYVEAAQKIRKLNPDARFLLAGPIDSNPSSIGTNDLNEWIKNKGIEYLGELKDVRVALEQSSIYVLPSYREGTPRTVLEAMAMGRPIITTDAPGCRETVEDGVNGILVPIQDSDALAQAMKKLLDYPTRHSMSQASLDIVGRKYDVNIVNTQMLQAMNLIERKNTSSVKENASSKIDINLQDTSKRCVDLLFSGILLAIGIIPMLTLAILIKIKLGSPVLFSQTRPGLSGKPFKMYKFRSMTDARDKNGQLLPDEKRLTSFGKFLRSTSLDELPGLFNVLVGDISLVGPRPLLMEYLPLYDDYQQRRHEVRPGITGWAQVNGRNALSWKQKFEHDVWYVDNRSMSLDINILIMTIGKVFKRDGISAQGEATMPKFTGNKIHD